MMTEATIRSHPGETLVENFMLPRNVSAQRLAAGLQMSRLLLEDIVCGRERITPDTARRLAEYFDTSAAFWTNLQRRHDVATGRP